MCCACGGGSAGYSNLECADANGEAGDSSNDGCDWYDEYPSGCGLYDDDDFVSSVMCCACEGGSHYVPEELIEVCEDSNGSAADWGGDDCTWYQDNAEFCGSYDDDDFSAWDMCCACQPVLVVDDWMMYGEEAYQVFQAIEATVCIDTDISLDGDATNDGCEWYAGDNAQYCGLFDTDDFFANEYCCACGSGLDVEYACKDLDIYSDGDTTGDMCTAYSEH